MLYIAMEKSVLYSLTRKDVSLGDYEPQSRTIYFFRDAGNII